MGLEIEPLFGHYLDYSTGPGASGTGRRKYWRLRAKSGHLCPNGRRSMAVAPTELEHYRARIAAAKPTVPPPPDPEVVARAIEAVRGGRSPAVEAARARAVAQGLQ